MERNLILKEINNLVKLRQYEQPLISAPAFTLEQKKIIVKLIQDVAELEHEKWKGKKEDIKDMDNHVKRYWTIGVGLNNKEASTIISERKEDIKAQKGTPRHPWSAAFVSFIMRSAYPGFIPSSAHNRYIVWAQKNRKSGDHPFQAYKSNEASVEPGDIICYARDTKNWATFDKIEGRLTHGDIVIRVEDGTAHTIGGNVDRSVGKKKYALDINGQIVQTYKTINKKKHPRFIAIIKLLPFNALLLQEELPDKEFEFDLPKPFSSEWIKVKESFSTEFWDITAGILRKKGNNGFTETKEEWEKRKSDFKTSHYNVITESLKGKYKTQYKDPEEWYHNFTRFTLLGKEIIEPIHVELATYLTFVEQKLINKYGGPVADINNNPIVARNPTKIAAEALGLKNKIHGGRGESSTAGYSMHTFGLAIDLEKDNNPYLGGNLKNPDTIKKLRKYGYVLPRKEPFEKIKVINQIFNRAGLLLNGVSAVYPSSSDTSNAFGRADLFDRLVALNDLTKEYFGLIDKSDDDFLKLLRKNNVDVWQGKTISEARDIVKKDFDWFRNLVGRYCKSKDKQQKCIEKNMLIKEHGFLNLDKRLVVELGLAWGAEYGDMMHFDMRNQSIGKIIDGHRPKN